LHQVGISNYCMSKMQGQTTLNPQSGLLSTRWHVFCEVLSCADAQGLGSNSLNWNHQGQCFKVSVLLNINMSTHNQEFLQCLRVTGLSARCSAAMHISVHTTCVSWLISDVFHSQDNDYSSENTTNCPPSGEEERLTHHPHYTLSLVVASCLLAWRIDALRASDALYEMTVAHSRVSA